MEYRFVKEFLIVITYFLFKRMEHINELKKEMTTIKIHHIYEKEARPYIIYFLLKKKNNDDFIFF